jgi:hypothetical protein
MILLPFEASFNANKFENDIVKCEQFYDEIDGVKDCKIRADISISRNKIIHTIIEVKREEAIKVYSSFFRETKKKQRGVLRRFIWWAIKHYFKTYQNK